MSEKHSIAFIDDDTIVTPYYSSTLILNGYDVQIFESADIFSTTLSSNSDQRFDLYIVDIMLPPGKKYSRKLTNSGLSTGLFLAQDIRIRFKEKPIILLSNQTLDSVRKWAKQLSARLENCISLNKASTQPETLVEIVNRYFQEFELKPRQQKNIFSRLYNSLVLEPNISGIGIDLKKLRDDE